MTSNTSIHSHDRPVDTQGTAANVLTLQKAKGIVYKYGLLVVLLLMIGYFSVTQPFFRTFVNAMFILQAASIVAVIGLGCTVSMTVGGFDLSVGSAMSLSIMAAAAAMVIGNMGGVPAILIGIAAGTCRRASQQLPDRGGAHPRPGGDPVVPVPDQRPDADGRRRSVGRRGHGVPTARPPPGSSPPIFKWLGSGKVYSVPSSVIVAGVILVLVVVLLNYTRWGRAFYAVGGNPVAAAAAGIRVARYRVVAYLISGGLAAIAGLMLAARSNRGDVNVGDAFLLQAVSAALVGYAVLGANRPNAFGTLIGAIFVAVLINGLTMFNFPYYAQSFVQGLLLMVALLMSYTLGPNRS